MAYIPKEFENVKKTAVYNSSGKKGKDAIISAFNFGANRLVRKSRKIGNERGLYDIDANTNYVTLKFISDNPLSSTDAIRKELESLQKNGYKVKIGSDLNSNVTLSIEKPKTILRGKIRVGSDVVLQVSNKKFDNVYDVSIKCNSEALSTNKYIIVNSNDKKLQRDFFGSDFQNRDDISIIVDKLSESLGLPDEKIEFEKIDILKSL